MRLSGIAVLAAAAAVAASGCGKSNNHAQAEPRAPGAKVTFVKPKRGATTGSTVVAKVKVRGFKLVPEKVGKPSKQGQGLLHFSMDNGKFDRPKYSRASKKLPVPPRAKGQYSAAVKPTITYEHLPKGKHTLAVFLANNDNSETGVQATTTFTVK